MAVLRWDPWGELASLQRDVNELFGRTVGQDAGRARGQGLVPPIDAFRSDEGLVVRVELPGLAPENVDVSVQDGVLTISGERGIDADVPDDAWVRRERPVGQFQRSFSLPEGVDADRITAAFEHGVLELRVPHPPERKPHRVQVSSGAGGREAIDVGERQDESS
jgi:HSP20 family protein